MDASNPIIADDKQSDEERLERERLLREQGLNPHELSSEEADDLIDDLRSDRISNDLADDDDRLSNIVAPEEEDR